MNDPQILAALKDVLDPELGINIVDLGLIYHADWTAVGIEVAMTLTAPTCPAAELLVEQAGSALRRHFPEMRNIRVDLVLDRRWSPDRMSEDGRRALGWLRTTTDSMGAIDAIMPAVSTRWKH